MQGNNLPVTMICHDLGEIPQVELPPSYPCRVFRPGDEGTWVKIQAAADLYNTITLDLFHREFGDDLAQIAARQFFLCDEQDIPIGTATAWFDDDFQGQRYGRIHWVAIVPEHQGRGLAKPLMTAVCRKLKALGHNRAYLTTSTARIPAINLYLQFGFRPHVTQAEETAVWQALQPKLKTPIEAKR